MGRITGSWYNPEDNAALRNGGTIVGGGNQLIREASDTQKHKLGEKLEFDDGTIMRYVKTIGAVTVGRVIAHDVSASDIGKISGRLSSKSSTSAAAADTTYAAGDTEIYVQDSTVFAGGYLGFNNGTRYRIRSNTIGDLDEVQGMIKFEIHAPGLNGALDSEEDLWVIGNKYNNCKISSANTDAPGVGVLMATTTANQFAWAITRGVVSVLCDESAGTVAINSPAVLSDGTDGALTVFGQGTANSEENLSQLTTEAIVGRWLQAGVNGDTCACWVDFE